MRGVEKTFANRTKKRGAVKPQPRIFSFFPVPAIFAKPRFGYPFYEFGFKTLGKLGNDGDRCIGEANLRRGLVNPAPKHLAMSGIEALAKPIFERGLVNPVPKHSAMRGIEALAKPIFERGLIDLVPKL